MAATITYTYDPPLSFEQVEEQLGPDARRLMELAIVDEAIKHNGGIVSVLMARHLGYDELAEQLQAELVKRDTGPLAGFTTLKARRPRSRPVNNPQGGTMRLVWDDGDYIEAWKEVIGAGSLRPNIDVAQRAGVSPMAVAQRMSRIRRLRPDLPNGNVARGSGCCPTCGASPAQQRPDRVARRREYGLVDPRPSQTAQEEP